MKACILITDVLTCVQGREALLRNNTMVAAIQKLDQENNQNSDVAIQQEFFNSGVTNGERLIVLIAECMPSYDTITNASFSINLRAVLNAITMIALSSKKAQYILTVRCGVVETLEQFLTLTLPSIRLRLDIEMALAAVNGEIENDTKEKLLSSMASGRGGGGGRGSGNFDSSGSLSVYNNNKKNGGDQVTFIKNCDGVIGMRVRKES